MFVGVANTSQPMFVDSVLSVNDFLYLINWSSPLQVLQNDVAMGRYLTDDCIGSYSFNLKQLVSAKPEQQGKGGGWTGWVTLANARRGRVRLSLTWEILPDAIRELMCVCCVHNRLFTKRAREILHDVIR